MSSDLSPLKRLLRRVPLLRRVAYRNALTIRKAALETRWQYTRSVLALVGETTINWAGVERMLDELIAFYQHRYTDLSAQHPVSLSKKIEYIKTRMEREPSFTPETHVFLRQARIDVTRLGKERHEIIHGMLFKTGTVVWRTQRVAYNKAVAHIVYRKFHNNDILKVYTDIGEFMRWLGPRVWALVGADRTKYPRHRIEEALRELGIN